MGNQVVVNRVVVNDLNIQGRRTYQSASMVEKTVRVAVLYPSYETDLQMNLGTVLLHLFAGALARRSSSLPKPIPALYIPVPSPFPILESFIQATADAYNLDLFHCVPRPSSSTPVESVETPPIQPNKVSATNGHAVHAPRPVGKSKGGEGMRRGLELYQKHFPNITAILIGTRRTDPHGGKSVYIIALIQIFNLRTC